MKKQYEPIPLYIGLHTLALHRKVEKWGKAEPYLWNIFFKVDGEAIKVNSQFKIENQAIFYCSEGSHGNLQGSIYRNQNILHIPKNIGEWKTLLQPIQVPYFEQFAPGIAGVITVLMEQNNVSYEGAEAARNALFRLVQKATNQALADFDPRFIDINDIQNSITNYFSTKVSQFSGSIEKEVIEAVKTKQTLLQNVWSLINTDNLIGFHVWNFNHKELEEQKGTIHFNHKWNTEKYGEWEIFGRVTSKNN